MNTIKTSFNHGFSINEGGKITRFPCCQWKDDPFYTVKDGALFKSRVAQEPLKKVRDLVSGTRVLTYDGHTLWFVIE